MSWWKRTVRNMVITLVGVTNSDKSVAQRGEYFYEERLSTTWLFIYFVLFNLGPIIF
jgi:hypothetical protein